MKKKTMSESNILDNQSQYLQVADSGILKVCICGEHTNDSIPISRLTGCGVLLHYIDKNGDVVPWKFDSLKDKIEGMENPLDVTGSESWGYETARDDILKLLEK